MFLCSFLVSLVQNDTESVQLVAGNTTVPTTQAPNPVTAATLDIRSANSREFVQSVAASKTEPRLSYVVLITTISCFNLYHNWQLT